MVSNLLKKVRQMAKDNNWDMTSFRDSRIRSIERKLDAGDISADDAAAQVASEFGYQFRREAKEALRRSLR